MSDKVTKSQFEIDDIASIHSIAKDDHRTGSSFGAYVNIVCVVAGTGTLGLPYAVKQGGWISLVFFVLTAFIAIYTSRLLIECLYYKPNQRLEEFPDVGEAAFGKFGRYFVKVFHYSISLSAACIYILLTGKTVSSLISDFNNGNDILGFRIWILIAGVIITVPSAVLKSLKEVAILAAFGAFCTLVVVFCVAIGGGIQYNSPDHPPPVTEVAIWRGIPLSLATIAFSYGGNVVYPHVEGSMRHPKSWNKVMMFAVGSITFMYLLIGITGYLYYGSDVKSPILDSLPQGAASVIAKVLITLHVILAAPIYICSFSLEQENLLKIDRKYISASREFVLRVILRTIIGAILTVIAMFVPYFSALMSLVGAISNCLIVFLVPVACHYKLFGWRNRPIWEYILTVVVIIVGLLGLILGSIDSVITLVDLIKVGDATSAKH
ncbi:hypothetical protein K502DRAFT_325628 [Neoconidiobolus thromboides FSU 785]|nr:hypothetical protein K502DRAFT_325628 [Neoconidiobolus thromboides FSU 785]